jgi:hypothetical protein
MLDPHELALLSVAVNALQEGLLLVEYSERCWSATSVDLRRIKTDLSRAVHALSALQPPKEGGQA